MSDDDVGRVREALAKFAGHGVVKHDWIWTQGSACKVIDCVLSLRKPYYKVVEPRVRAFALRHGIECQLQTLLKIATAYPSPQQFSVAELSMNSRQKGEIIIGVTERLLALVENAVDQKHALTEWALKVLPSDSRAFGVKGFGLAGFQYLRMLFGADTAKPDQRVIEYVSAAIGRRCKDFEALDLLDRASVGLPLSLRALDMEIWEARARAAGTFVEKAL